MPSRHAPCGILPPGPPPVLPEVPPVAVAPPSPGVPPPPPITVAPPVPFDTGTPPTDVPPEPLFVVPGVGPDPPGDAVVPPAPGGAVPAGVTACVDGPAPDPVSCPAMPVVSGAPPPVPPIALLASEAHPNVVRTPPTSSPVPPIFASMN